MLTFHKDLARGKQIEEMVLSHINKKYPEAYIVDGYFKEWDIYVPEVQKSVEVKSDEKSKYTGNIVIEVEFNGKPSALHTTKADYWVIHDGYEFHWFLPEMIMKCIWENNLRTCSFIGKGDTKEKKAYLIKKEMLYRYEQSKFTPKVSAII
jgi:hypothetical protein